MFTISCIGSAFLSNCGTFMEVPSWYTVHSRKLPAGHPCGVEWSVLGSLPLENSTLKYTCFIKERILKCQSMNQNFILTIGVPQGE